MAELTLTPEHQEALREYEMLMQELPVLEEEKDRLIHHVRPQVLALYTRLIGEYKLELLKAQTEAYALRRKLEMIQASLNRGEPVLIEVVEALLRSEMKEHYERVEQEVRRMEKALKVTASTKLTNEESAELKSLYHALARKLHPDFHPGQAEHQKNLWLNVMDAYKDGDLPRMKVLALLCDEDQQSEQTFKRSLEDVLKKNEVLKTALRALSDQLIQVKNSFPLNLIDKLEDADWVKQETKLTQAETVTVLRQQEDYRTLIAKLLSGETL